MSNDHIRPSSIEGVKQFAKRFKKSDGIQHALALDGTSKAAGFENYKHALRQLGDRFTVSLVVGCALNAVILIRIPLVVYMSVNRLTNLTPYRRPNLTPSRGVV